MHSEVEDIKARLDIAEVLSQYLRLEKAGANYKARCPFHNEKSPSFMVSTEKQIWHCFGCQKGGDIFSFVMEMEGLEFRDALKLLADRAGVELTGGKPSDRGQRAKLLAIVELATKFYEYQLWSTSGKPALEYLRARGLTDQTIKDFRIGFAPRGWRHLITFFTKRNYDLADVLKAGLILKKEGADEKQHYDRFRERIIFPIADVNSRIVGFTARVLPGADETQAKYVNTPETDLYHKGRILFGLHRAKAEIRRKDATFLVEGNMDVIACHQAGLTNAVGVSGTALTDEQVTILKRYSDKVQMCFDMDGAGQAATRKSISLCFSHDMEVKVIELAGAKDAAEIIQKDPQEFLATTERGKDVVEYFFSRAFARFDRKTIDGRKHIADELLGVLSELGNGIEQAHWIKKLGSELEVPEDVLTDRLKKATLKRKVAPIRLEHPDTERFVPKSKLETLTDELIGLMLVYPDAWRTVAQLHERDTQLDPLIRKLIETGVSVAFSFDTFRRSLNEDAEIARIDRCFFEKRYRLNLNGVLEEVAAADPTAEAQLITKRIRQEWLRKEQQQITQDMKRAEERGDREAVLFLRRQFEENLPELQD